MTPEAKAHSKFSPSSAERWWNCAFSIKANENAPRKTSIYAAEGTAAHEVASAILSKMWTKHVEEAAEEWIGEKIEVEEFMIEVTENMAEALQVYINEVKRVIGADDGQGKLYVEMWQPMSLHDETCGGTMDVIYVSDKLKRIYIRDYKHGAGYAVDANENKQMLQYAASVLDSARSIEEFDLGIVQPRCSNKDGAIRTKTYSRAYVRDHLMKMAEKILDAKASPDRAKSGSWCKWCAINGNCTAQLDDKNKKIINQFDSAALVPSLTPDQIRKALDMESEVLDFFKALREQAMQMSANGMFIPGYKRVEKFGHRKWRDEENAKAVLELSFGDDAFEKKLVSPAKAEKLFGKGKKGKEDFLNSCGDMVETPSSGFALVPADDARDSHEDKVIAQLSVAALPSPAPVDEVDLSDLGI